MSNIYIQEPPTNGKVCLETTVGDIEIELWSRECPKACRNFLQLCMESYYNKTKFHRVVKEFIVQGGDPGNGGESIFGQPFKDEFHSRLRFVRRGLVAMANAGKDDNGSQFFFTMGPTQELQNKHTIFGKVVGDTVYNMVKLQEGETDENERPLYPNKILKARVISNPFTDIVPRETIQRIRHDSDEKNSHKKKSKSKMKATKDFSLISFGEEAEEEENDLEAVQKSYRNKSKSSHDLLDDPKLSSEVGKNEKPSNNEQALSEDQDDVQIRNENKRKVDDETDISSIRSKLQRKNEQKHELKNKSKADNEYDTDDDDEELTSQKRKREEIKREIIELQREMKGLKDKNAQKEVKVETSDKEKSLSESEQGNDMLLSFHREQEKYASKKVNKKGSSREAETMALLAKFQAKLGK